MDSYRSAYQKYDDGQAPAPYMPMGYQVGGMPPMMNAVHSPPMGHAPYAPYAAPAKQHMSTSARIITEPGCQVFRSTRDATPLEHTARQIIAVDGKVFVEHVPGHNLFFVPIEMPPTAALRAHTAGPRILKARARAAPLARPSNVFFKYRSVKQRELQLKHPRLNQTVISRMVAECWKRESSEVKDRYKSEYKEDMKRYELNKKINRARPEFEYFEEDVSVAGDSGSRLYGAQQVASEPQSFVNEPQPLGLSQPSASSVGRHRSFTMPELDKSQNDLNRLIH
ncbi:hypothetical protein IWW52_002691 [Coemansia sp. RSA 2704]|nr:hypothetical protein IWW54_002602 [Coemansia sp. RSA 2705]KAJ2318210.1 hypothetical protein IWW52_002691 [Coemansia sp. RSA 2704]